MAFGFPKASNSNAEPVPIDGGAKRASNGAKAARILVVDDESHVRTMVGSTLERNGHAIKLASSGAT